MTRLRLAWLAALAPALLAGEVAPEDPPICVRAIEARPEATALEALEAAEQEANRMARRLSSDARRASKKTLGGSAGSTAVRKLMREADEAREQSVRAKQDAKRFCYCRQRRDDPHREDCERLYPLPLP